MNGKSKGISVTALCLISLLLLFGCAQKPTTAGSKEAIDTASAMESMQEKAAFLMKEAQAFYSSEKFQDAIDTAQYVLRYVDKDSQAAKDLIERAKQELIKLAESKTAEMKEKVLDLGK